LQLSVKSNTKLFILKKGKNKILNTGVLLEQKTVVPEIKKNLNVTYKKRAPNMGTLFEQNRIYSEFEKNVIIYKM